MELLHCCILGTWCIWCLVFVFLKIKPHGHPRTVRWGMRITSLCPVSTNALCRALLLWAGLHELISSTLQDPTELLQDCVQSQSQKTTIIWAEASCVESKWLLHFPQVPSTPLYSGLLPDQASYRWELLTLQLHWMLMQLGLSCTKYSIQTTCFYYYKRILRAL